MRIHPTGTQPCTSHLHTFSEVDGKTTAKKAASNVGNETNEPIVKGDSTKAPKAKLEKAKKFLKQFPMTL